VGLRLTPQENSFYDLFAKSASHLVNGSRELTKVLGADPASREPSTRFDADLANRS